MRKRRVEGNQRNVKFSVITPTYEREKYLIRQYYYFKEQTYPEKEWLILDDSPTPSAFFLSLKDSEIHYLYSPTRLSIGEKRNRLIEKASGKLIAHFDDDDFYAPHYLNTMADYLKDLDFVKLSAWYVYSEKHNFWGYCDHENPHPSHYYLSANSNIEVIENFQSDLKMLWGYGFSYAYHRAVWETFPFEPINFGEDHNLVLQRLLKSSFQSAYFPDTQGIVLHILHQSNASESFPQYRLSQATVPSFLLTPIQETVLQSSAYKKSSILWPKSA